MFKRIAAIATIFIGASIAWAVLGTTIFTRTYSSDATAQGRVTSTWGAPHTQAPPSATYVQLVPKIVETFENGKKISGSNE